LQKGIRSSGFHFSPEGFLVAEKMIEKFLARAVRFYEQEQGESFGSPLLGSYVRRWERWVKSMSVHLTGLIWSLRTSLTPNARPRWNHRRAYRSFLCKSRSSRVLDAPHKKKRPAVFAEYEPMATPRVVR